MAKRDPRDPFYTLRTILIAKIVVHCIYQPACSEWRTHNLMGSGLEILHSSTPDKHICDFILGKKILYYPCYLTQSVTDGSKEDSKVGCAVISDNRSNMQRIPDDSSVFTAETKAVDLALDFIRTCDANNKFIIFSDSLSVLKAMNHASSKNPQIQKLLEKCHELLTNKIIVLCWIPSHIGIQGNEMVDK